jgi:hypothetical protein
MSVKKNVLLVALAVMSFIKISFGQSLPVLDQNPTGIKWYQINTPKFRVVYPGGFEREAQRMANTLQTIYGPVSRTLEKEPRPISIVLQNQTAVSNGFVTLTPRRSEFYTAPPQNYNLLGTNDWLNLLAVHEFRHIVQFDKALTGFTKGVYYVFGGNGLSLIANLSVPGWFWEGDAVGAETALTSSGRGRIPNFHVDFRTFLLEKGPFTYQKAFLGSYKDFITPAYSRYKMGYFMTTYLKREYGPNTWSRILNRTYNFPLLPFVFSNAIKKETGMRVEDLYNATMNNIGNKWREQLEGLPVTEASIVPTGNNRVFTNYEYPQFLSDGSILAQKYGLADIETFVVLNKNESEVEKKVFVPGIVLESGMLSVMNDVLVWAEQTFDPRWGMRDYTVIKSYNLKTREARQITRKSRLSAPALSPDGQKIVAVQVSVNNEYNLVILDSQTGRELKKLNNTDNHFYIMPRWSPDGQQLMAVKLTQEGKTIEVTDVNTGESKDLLPYRQINIAHPVMYGEYVYFNSPYNDIDNIHAVHIHTGKEYQVTSRKYGAYNPAISPDGSTIAFNDFTVDGFRIATMPNNPGSWTPVEQVKVRTVDYYAPLVEQEGNHNILDSIPANQYQASRFSKGKHIFNPYSWSPIISSDARGLTVSLASQDILSTTQAEAGVGYNANEQTANYFANVSYQGFYPVLDATFETGPRNVSLTIDNEERSDTWQESNVILGARLPLNFTHNKYIQRVNVSAHTSLTLVNGYDLPRRRFSDISNGSMQAMLYGVSYRRLLKRSIRDIAPRWGQTVAVNLRHTPFGGSFQGQLFAATGNLYFPGIGRHHSLRIRAQYQQEDQSNYRFTSPLLYPRGHEYTSHLQFYGGSAEYRLPLFNPDWAVGRWLYFRRFNGGLFYDFGQGETRQGTRQYQSVGVDLTTEFYFMRLPVPLELGVRTIYLPDTNKWDFQFLVIEVGF